MGCFGLQNVSKIINSTSRVVTFLALKVLEIHNLLWTYNKF